MDSEIRRKLLNLFKQEELVNEWLNTSKWYFDDLTPLVMLQTAVGKEAVLTYINRIHYGDF